MRARITITRFDLAALLIRDGWVLCGSEPSFWLERGSVRCDIWLRAAQAAMRKLELKPDATATEYPRWLLP
jgi:hypothetical protein